MLEKEYNYFKKNKKTLLRKYANKFIVIVGKKVVGSYATIENALKESSQKYSAGTFLIQKISENQDELTQRFFSANVCFR
ncbi:hypothetical protein KKF70_03340 [bacterium]|nr:hypothetical protein [Candidatus Omnitrophota bacterium]MBU2528404.1 hypothetical protein [bacterium]MBU3930662.1 hypothetical protein [bacterium]MBU4123432.1 hypothetical protein [bacterium]